MLLLVIPTAVLLKVGFDWRAGVTRARARRVAPPPLADRSAARRRRRALRLLQARRQRSAARERARPVQLARRGSLPTRPDRALDGQAPGRARPCGRARAHERADRAALARPCGGAPTTAAERAFLAVVPAALLWVLVETGAFAATTTPALFERYTFYLEPLLLLAFVVWLTRGLPRPRIGTAVALGVPALLLLSLTLAQIVSPDAVNGVTLSALYRFIVHLPGGIHELKAAIAVGGRAGGLPVRDLREADRPDRAAAVAGRVLRRRRDLDHRQHSQRRGTRDRGQRPELGRACRRSRQAGRLREHAGARARTPRCSCSRPSSGTRTSGTSTASGRATSASCRRRRRRSTPRPGGSRRRFPRAFATRSSIGSVPFAGTRVAVGGSGDGPLALYRVDRSLRVGTTTEGRLRRRLDGSTGAVLGVRLAGPARRAGWS